MLWRFLRTKPFIDSYSASRDRWSNASPLFLGPPLKFVDDMAMTWQGMEYGLDKVIDFTMTLLIVQFIQKLSYSKFMAEESKTTVVYDTE